MVVVRPNDLAFVFTFPPDDNELRCTLSRVVDRLVEAVKKCPYASWTSKGILLRLVVCLAPAILTVNGAELYRVWLFHGRSEEKRVCAA